MLLTGTVLWRKSKFIRLEKKKITYTWVSERERGVGGSSSIANA